MLDEENSRFLSFCDWKKGRVTDSRETHLTQYPKHEQLWGVAAELNSTTHLIATALALGPQEDNRINQEWFEAIQNGKTASLVRKPISKKPGTF